MRLIELTNGGHAIVDEADFDSLSSYRWYGRSMGKTRYALRKYWIPAEKKTYSVSMHRQILGATHGQLVDHKNGDGLDNRRSNLRFATKSQNAANSRDRKPNKSGYRGVYRYAKGTTKPWTAKISVNCREVSLGYYALPEEAAEAYNAAAIKFHGEFAVLNEIRREPMKYKPFNEHNPVKVTNMKPGDYLLHGDVILFMVDALPSDFDKMAPVKDGIIAYGEATHHVHQLFGGYDLREDAKKERHLRIVEPVKLKHQEHREIVLPPGGYRIGIQREYSPWDKLIRRVAD